jgi:hypothetical protein
MSGPSFSEIRVPSLSTIDKRVKSKMHLFPNEKGVVRFSETSTEPVCASVKRYWSEKFGLETNDEAMSSQTREKMLEVLQKNFFMQVIWIHVVEKLITTNKEDVLAKVNTYKEKRLNPVILTVGLVLQFLSQGFVDQATDATRTLVKDSIDCCKQSIRKLGSYPGSGSYKNSMEKHSASLAGEDHDMKALCAHLIVMSNLSMYTVRSSDDEVDRVLGIATPEGEKSASGGGSTGTSKAPDSGEMSRKRSISEGETSTDADVRLHLQTASADDDILIDLAFEFFKSVAEDPTNRHNKWKFETLQLVKDFAKRCKKVPVRITHAIRFVETLQVSANIQVDVFWEIVRNTLYGIFAFETNNAEVESVVNEAIELLQQCIERES